MYISKMKSHLHQFSPRRHPRGLNLRCPGKVLSVSLPVCEHRARLLKYLAGCKSGKKICFSETVFYGFIEMIARRQPWCTADENTRDFLSNTQACLLANFDWIRRTWRRFFTITTWPFANIITEGGKKSLYSTNIIHYIGLIFIERGSNHSVLNSRKIASQKTVDPCNKNSYKISNLLYLQRFFLHNIFASFFVITII